MSDTDARRRSRGARVAMTLAVAISLPPTVARAQARQDVPPAEQAVAQALFDDAERLRGERRFDEACARLRESQALDPAPGTLLNLARCYEDQGKLATAWITYQEGAALAQRAGRGAWAALAARRLAALEPSVPRVVIRVASADTEVTRDGTPLAPAEWGLPLPVDPGELHLNARRPGKRPWSRELSIAEGERVVIDVGPLEEEEAPAGASPGPPAAAVPALPSERRSDARRDVQRYGAVGVAGLGVVGIAIGSGFGVDALTKKRDAASFCPLKSECADPRGALAASDARSSAAVSTAGFVAGGALLAAAAILYFTGPPPASARRSLGPPAWRLAVRPGGLAWEGTF